MAVRTFRIGPRGILYPLFTHVPWLDGTNTAQCRAVRPLDGEGVLPKAHAVVDPDCTCGFYAFAHAQGALESAHARYVLAVVACWGRVVAGTRGLRSEHARIVAIWMSDGVPRDIAAEVAARYPSSTVYADKTAMLVDHSPTRLDCYDPPAPPVAAAVRIGLGAVLTYALVIGLFPRTWIANRSSLLASWAVEVCVLLAAAVLLGRRPGLADKGRALLCSATVLWLAAPWAGAAGYLLLRLPLLQIAVLARRQRRRIVRAASRFPAEIS